MKTLMERYLDKYLDEKTVEEILEELNLDIYEILDYLFDEGFIDEVLVEEAL